MVCGVLEELMALTLRFFGRIHNMRLAVHSLVRQQMLTASTAFIVQAFKVLNSNKTLATAKYRIAGYVSGASP